MRTAHSRCLECAPQVARLRDLNRRGDHESVIRLFEGGQAASSEGALGEYVKALVAVDRLDTSSLIHTLRVSSSCRSHPAHATHGMRVVCCIYARLLECCMLARSDANRSPQLAEGIDIKLSSAAEGCAGRRAAEQQQRVWAAGGRGAGLQRGCAGCSAASGAGPGRGCSRAGHRRRRNGRGRRAWQLEEPCLHDAGGCPGHSCPKHSRLSVSLQCPEASAACMPVGGATTMPEVFSSSQHWHAARLECRWCCWLGMAIMPLQLEQLLWHAQLQDACRVLGQC
jgi:hypothetical protein